MTLNVYIFTIYKLFLPYIIIPKHDRNATENIPKQN